MLWFEIFEEDEEVVGGDFSFEGFDDALDEEDSRELEGETWMEEEGMDEDVDGEAIAGAAGRVAGVSW